MKKINKYLRIAVIALFCYLVLVGDFELSYSSKKAEYKVRYNGMVWCALDYYSILRYSSKDVPMPLIKFTQTKK